MIDDHSVLFRQLENPLTIFYILSNESDDYDHHSQQYNQFVKEYK